jgi:signal transduction histidine kinase
MRVVSCIAVLAAFRMVANYVTHPPLPWPAWTAINLLLLAGIAACVCLTMAIYLDPSRQGRWRWLASSLGVLLVGLVAFPAAWMFRWAEGWFGAVTVFGAVLFGRMVWRVVRTGDSLGWIIVAPVLGIVALGAHDLVLHLSRHSMSDDYLQRWSVPGLLVLMIVLLARRVAAQRTTEAALAAETMRREELLRDLHDGVGSRLVALSLHARWSGGDPQLAEEIDGLLRELQLIQSTVRAAPTTLQSLVADLRHLYSRLGGGAFPIHWPVADLPVAVPLSAEQAVAVVRIAEEAMANAMKHAHPSRIEIGCCTAQAPWQAILTIGDDGVGQFQPDKGQGLNNMRTRAERAGLGLVLLSAQPQDPLKKVQLFIPRPGSLDGPPSPWRGGWRAVIAAWWRRTGAYPGRG